MGRDPELTLVWPQIAGGFERSPAIAEMVPWSSTFASGMVLAILGQRYRASARGGGAMGKGIFISYRREDTAAYARALHGELKQSFPKQKIFLDVDDIPAGQDFVDYIEDRLNSSGVLIALIGKRWQSSRVSDAHDYVRREIAGAISRGITIVPVLIDGGKMPAAEKLPEDLAALPRVNALQLSHDRFSRDVEALFDTISLTLSTQYSPTAKSGMPDSAPPKPKTPSTFKLMLGIAVTAVLSIGVGKLFASASMVEAAIISSVVIFGVGLLISFYKWDI